MDKLTNNFRKKLELFLNDASAQGFSIYPFETWRSAERQAELYAQGRTKSGKIITWVKHSNHQDGEAADIVFKVNGQPSRSGDYDSLIVIGKKYGLRNLKPTETCHFEDDGTLLNTQKIIMEKYKYILQEEINKGYVPLFSKHEGSDTLSEADIKNLIDIAFARSERRIKEFISNVTQK